MCSYSMVADNLFKQIPWVNPSPFQPQTIPIPMPQVTTNIGPTKEEIKQWIKEAFDALMAARLVDKVTGQPDCEESDKLEKFEEIAKKAREVGVKIPRKARPKKGRK